MPLNAWIVWILPDFENGLSAPFSHCSRAPTIEVNKPAVPHAIQIISGTAPNANQGKQAGEELARSWHERKERMARMEALLMASIEHPHILKTYQVRLAGDLHAECL